MGSGEVNKWATGPARARSASRAIADKPLHKRLFSPDAWAFQAEQRQAEGVHGSGPSGLFAVDQPHSYAGSRLTSIASL